MNQNNECDNNTTCDKYMKKYFPISSDNVYGAIPLLGAVTSCFAVGILMQISYIPGVWFGICYFIGFLIFVVAQILWGFHAKNQKCLQLWIACKWGEVLVTIAGIIYAFVGYPYLEGLIGPSISLLVLLAGVLRVGYKKNKNFKKPENNVFAIQCPDKIITKY